MLCEKCHQNTATVHMTQITNNEKKEIHVCEKCANLWEMPFSIEHFLQGFVEAVLSVPNQATSGGSAKEHLPLQCAQCGLTFADFKNTSRLGCSECYDVFRNQLNNIFKSIQSGHTHHGKLPKRTGTQLSLKRKLEQLKMAQKKNIELEEYEKAATLRDEIRQLEKLLSTEVFPNE